MYYTDTKLINYDINNITDDFIKFNSVIDSNNKSTELIIRPQSSVFIQSKDINKTFDFYDNLKHFFDNNLFDCRDFIFYFRQLNKILIKPFNGYYYHFFLSFKRYNKIVADKSYAHQFCSFLNFKLKHCATFYLVDHLDNLFFTNYSEKNIFNFYIPSKGEKIDWTLNQYFRGQIKKIDNYYIELDFISINAYEIKKSLFFFNFYNFKYCSLNSSRLPVLNILLNLNNYNNTNYKSKFFEKKKKL